METLKYEVYSLVISPHTTRYPPQKLIFRYILTYLHSSTRVTNSIITINFEFKASAQFFRPEFYFYCSCEGEFHQNIYISVDVQLHDHSSLASKGDTWWTRTFSKCKLFITRIRLDHGGEKKSVSWLLLRFLLFHITKIPSFSCFLRSYDEKKRLIKAKN